MPESLKYYVLLVAVCELVGCESIHFLEEREDCQAIGDGRGSNRMLFSEDHYSRLLRLLLNSEEAVREKAAHDLDTNTGHLGVKYYMVLIDSYFDANRGEEVIGALEEGWQKSPPGSDERMFMRDAFINSKVRKYLWAHPEARGTMDLMLLKWDLGSRRAYGDMSGRPDTIIEDIIRDGDKELDEAWKEQQRWMVDLTKMGYSVF